MATKVCPRCNVEKDISEYHKGKCRYGIHHTCKKCIKTQNRQFRLECKERNELLGVSVSEKKCWKCNTVKPASEFPKDSNSKTGLHGKCKECNQKVLVEKKYGITLDWYNDLLKKQGGKCACCGIALGPRGQKGLYKPVIDHCHNTGTVRSIICSPCNTIEGLARDEKHLELIIKYKGLCTWIERVAPSH